MIKNSHTIFTEPGRRFPASGRNQQRGGGHQTQQYAQPQKGIDRRQSLSRVAKTSGNHPHLPKGGVTHNSSQRNSRNSGNEDFMKTPEAGQSG